MCRLLVVKLVGYQIIFLGLWNFQMLRYLAYRKLTKSLMPSHACRLCIKLLGFSAIQKKNYRSISCTYNRVLWNQSGSWAATLLLNEIRAMNLCTFCTCNVPCQREYWNLWRVIIHVHKTLRPCGNWIAQNRLKNPFTRDWSINIWKRKKKKKIEDEISFAWKVWEDCSLFYLLQMAWLGLNSCSSLHATVSLIFAQHINTMHKSRPGLSLFIVFAFSVFGNGPVINDTCMSANFWPDRKGSIKKGPPSCKEARV